MLRDPWSFGTHNETGKLCPVIHPQSGTIFEAHRDQKSMPSDLPSSRRPQRLGSHVQWYVHTQEPQVGPWKLGSYTQWSTHTWEPCLRIMGTKILHPMTYGHLGTYSETYIDWEVIPSECSQLRTLGKGPGNWKSTPSGLQEFRNLTEACEA